MCAAYRVRHSEFLAWSDSDRDKALWQHIRSRQACQGCGTRPDEWDPDKGGSRQAYRAVALQCEGCLKIQRGEQNLSKQTNPPLGMHMALIKPEGG